MALDKSKESGLSPEIGRLTAQLAKDPKSKLFIPLAEEYMKAGMAEEAVMALEEGLKANPSYMSARVLLGKAYLEKGDSAAARGQFESVVKAIPDNLLAHKKLADIYRDEGRYTDAIKSLRVVTILSPKDEEANKLLKELESGPPASAVTATKKPEKTLVESHREEDSSKAKTAYRPPAAAPAPAPALAASPAPAPMPAPQSVEPEMTGEDMESPASAPVYDLGEADEVEAVPEVMEMPVLEMATLEDVRMARPPADIQAEEAQLIFEVPSVVEDENPFGVAEEVSEHDADVTNPSMPKPNMGYAVDLKDKGDLNEIFASYGVSEEEAAVGTDESVYEIADDGAGLEAEAFDAGPVEAQAVELEAVEEAEPEAPAPTAEAAQKEPFKTETLAEIYISQGFFDRAINIYKDLLVESPDNKELKQKLDELYMLAGVSSAKAVAKAKEEVKRPQALDAEPSVTEAFEAEPFGGAPVEELPTEAAPFEVAPFEAAPLEAAAFEEPPGADLWSVEAAPFEAEPVEAAPFEAAPLRLEDVPTQPAVKAPLPGVVVDPAAVGRLEQFLDNIRRKGAR